jgi:hypothetical protein
MKYKYKVMKLPDNYLMSAPGGAITYSASSDFFKVEEKEPKKRKMFSSHYYHEYDGKQVIGYICGDDPPQ